MWERHLYVKYIMKKYILILFALLITTFTNAQLTLVHSVSGYAYTPCAYFNHHYTYRNIENKFMIYSELPCPFYMQYFKTESEAVVQFISPIDFSEYKMLDITTHVQNGYELFVLTYDLFVKDKIAVVLLKNSSALIVDEDGKTIKDFDLNTAGIFLMKMDKQWQLVYTKTQIVSGIDNMEIYALPGDGEALNIEAPTSQKTSSARKVVRDGQVYVETESNTFSVTGQEVK